MHEPQRSGRSMRPKRSGWTKLESIASSECRVGHEGMALVIGLATRRKIAQPPLVDYRKMRRSGAAPLGAASKIAVLLAPPQPIISTMKRDEVLATLKASEADLRAHGVIHAALFGSVARDEQNAESDIDILVDLDPVVVATMFDYAALKDYVAGLFDVRVDVVDREALKPRVRPKATADAVYAI